MKGLVYLALAGCLTLSPVNAMNAHAYDAPQAIVYSNEDVDVNDANLTEEGSDNKSSGEEAISVGSAIDGALEYSQEHRGESGISEEEASRYIDGPKAQLDSQTANFIETTGGKILGILLKVLSVGLLVTIAADLCFVGVPFTQGIFLSLERSGIPIVSNEAHIAAGVPREQKQGGQQRGGSGGYNSGYNQTTYNQNYNHQGMNGQQGQQQPGSAEGIKGYIKSSLVKMILVLAFAVFCLSNAYVHLAYVIGDMVGGAVNKI